MWHDLLTWWRGGDLLMPIMLMVGVVLYAVVGERCWALFGPGSRQLAVRDEGDGWALELELTRGLGVIRALAAILPLLGLLGTVAGMVDTFAQLGAQGAQQRSTGLGQGVAMALTATQYGLALAIPAVVADWLLRRRVSVLRSRCHPAMEGAAHA